MQTLTVAECATWLQTAEVKTFGAYEIVFERPRDSHAQGQLARFLVLWLEGFDAALFWLTDWPFYQPDEMALIMGLRRSHGETRNLIESPGHVFSFAESSELTGWVSLILRFRWDVQVVARPFRGDAFNTSHHDTVQVWSASAERFDAVREAVQFFGLAVVRETPAA